MLTEKEFYVRPDSRSIVLRTERIICESYVTSTKHEGVKWSGSYDDDDEEN